MSKRMKGCHVGTYESVFLGRIVSPGGESNSRVVSLDLIYGRVRKCITRTRSDVH